MPRDLFHHNISQKGKWLFLKYISIQNYLKNTGLDKKVGILNSTEEIPP